MSSYTSNQCDAAVWTTVISPQPVRCRCKDDNFSTFGSSFAFVSCFPSPFPLHVFMFIYLLPSSISFFHLCELRALCQNSCPESLFFLVLFLFPCLPLHSRVTRPGRGQKRTTWAETMGRWKVMGRELGMSEVCVRPPSSRRLLGRLKPGIGRAVLLAGAPPRSPREGDGGALRGF